ncbi:AMP-binding protein [Pseudenhygromyxa sp. WMMC2535]|uniref:AMP-binding protein n=1 Tax=Pseudenhygromyxa sp. WMMC2535 TaxID=2712867 RepID=UPI0015543C47|nr:AMP-binding protein [Pseudenhygromyxa sp. WMMC2535]NVB42532.1 AMP-binding protein [Pseudenhygromyxa sp. WMMC2535]
MTERHPVPGLPQASSSVSVATLASVVAPRLVRAPGLSPILAHHQPEAPVTFGAAGIRSAERLRIDVARVAAVLPSQEPGGGDEREILCVASDRYHFTVALLAAWQRGHRVALPPNAQPEFLRGLAEDPAISLVIHDTDEMTGLDLRPLLAEETRATPPAEPLELAPLAADRRLVSIWTSGSTGEHQRHAKTAGQLFAEALVLADHFGLAAIPGSRGDHSDRAGVRVVATVPSHHIYGLLFSVLVPLVSGGSFLRETPLHAGVVRAAIVDNRADVLVSVPAHLRALRILDPGQLPPLARVFSSGAALPAATAAMLDERFDLAITEILGSTETGGIVWRTSEGGAPGTWTPLPHVRVDVDPEEDQGSRGQLLVDSPFLPPDGSRPWRTADRVELLAGGRLRHLGRVDGVVKIGGKRIALAEIERRLLAIEGVEDAAVGVVEVGGARGQETVALAVAPGLSPELLRHELRRWLDPVVVPRRLRLVDALPREDNGKLPRRRLLEALEQPKPKVRNLECALLEAGDDQGAGASWAEYALYVPRDLYALRGHFRSFPIVPGVLELALAREQAVARWPQLGRLSSARRLKFLRPLRPGERLQMSLRRRGQRVDFQLYRGDDKVGVGTLEFV